MQFQTLALRRPFKGPSLMLGLYQRHALKAFRASVGDEEDHAWKYTSILSPYQSGTGSRPAGQQELDQIWVVEHFLNSQGKAVVH